MEPRIEAMAIAQETTCPICGDYSGAPRSVAAHISGMSDDLHKGEVGRSYEDELFGDRPEEAGGLEVGQVGDSEGRGYEGSVERELDRVAGDVVEPEGSESGGDTGSEEPDDDGHEEGGIPFPVPFEVAVAVLVVVALAIILSSSSTPTPNPQPNEEEQPAPQSQAGGLTTR